MVALQILVIVAEYQNQRNMKDKPEEYMPTEPGRLIKRIYMKESQGLLQLLIKRSLRVYDEAFTIDEMRLVARAFASLPASELIEANFHVFDQATLEETKKQNSEELQAPSKPSRGKDRF